MNYKITSDQSRSPGKLQASKQVYLLDVIEANMVLIKLIEFLATQKFICIMVFSLFLCEKGELARTFSSQRTISGLWLYLETVVPKKSGEIV